MKKLLVLLCAIFALLHSRAQDTAKLQQVLRQTGFEDIRVAIDTDTAFVAIENHTYRGTFRGAANAIEGIAAQCPDIQHIELLLTDYKQPQLIVHASRRGAEWNVSVDRHMRQARRHLKSTPVIAPSTGKVDIVAYPMVSLTNNKLDHLFDYAVRIAPAIGITLWQGARLTLQPILPIAHRLDWNDSQRRIQIGNTNIRQQLFTSRRWQASAALGFFHAERLGIQADVTFHAMRQLDIFIDGGLTGQATNRFSGFLFAPWKRVNFMAGANYYERHTKLEVECRGGRFLYGDYGGRIDLTRHFGEYTIGVYGILTGGESNAGFHFAIPVAPKRCKQTKAVRLRLPDYYSMEYSMHSYFKYWEERMGQSYDTQPDQNRSAHYWEPDFVQEYIARILNGTFK